MIPRTPPLPALRAFAAVVRLGSIAAASEELSLTPSAVGHQIRALEHFLDVQLIERQGRRLCLTEEGRVYGYQVRQALADIADATERAQRRLHTSKDPLLRISVLPSFAYGWLLPRLPKFYRRYPEIRFDFHGSTEYAALDEGRIDCAIRFGHGNWPDAVTRPLMRDRLLLVTAPTRLQEQMPETLAQLLQQPLLHSSENWSAFFSSMPTQNAPVQRPLTQMAFNDSTHLLEAARLGLGVGLTRRVIADELLRQGTLVRAWPHECEHTSRYYALTPISAPQHHSLQLFLDWLQLECADFASQSLRGQEKSP